ncbi:type II toxin-antitoxin system VapC family toxin [Spirochaeta dissipatitropha]
MTNSILIDSGPIIALFDHDDSYHFQIKEYIKINKCNLITTTAVATEVSHMLNFNVNVQIAFLEWILREGIILFEIQQKHISRIIELTKKYADLPMDFADATLVIAAEHTGIRKIISIDSDFDIYRLPGKELIQNQLYK